MIISRLHDLYNCQSSSLITLVTRNIKEYRHSLLYPEFIMALPTTTDEWVIDAPSSQAIGLRLREMVPIPALGEDEVLLEIKAVALNFRDIAIARVGCFSS